MLRNIPTVTRNLLILNVLAFLVCIAMGKDAPDSYRLNGILGLHFFMARDFHLYQLVTYMFMHGGFAHLFFNMFALWMFGCVIEQTWGPKKFLFYYIICGIGAGITQELAQLAAYHLSDLAAYDFVAIKEGNIPMELFLNRWTTVGASGAIYGILLAFGMLYPENRIFVFPIPVPIKAKWFVVGYAAIEVFYAINSSGDGVAHVAHLGGMLFGLLLIVYWKRHGSHFDRQASRNVGQEFFNRMRGNSHAASHRQATERESDWDYNARKKAEQDEVDRILDKIRKSGYDSLSKKEKQQLFDVSNKR